MSSTVKLAGLDWCCVCGTRGPDLQHVDTLDANLPPGETTLHTKLATIADDKVVAGNICSKCVERASDAWSFQQQLRASQSQPSLSEKIRLLRQRLRELSNKVDVFIVIGPEKEGQLVYSEDNIIMIDKNMLGEANEEEYETTTNETGDKVYQCSICPKTCAVLSEIMEHSNSHPSDSPKTCWTCGKQFTNKELYKAHVRVHRTVDDLVCKLCGTLFQSQSELKSHSCELRCPSCRVVFGDRGALTLHVRSRHGAAGAPPHACPLCMETFARPERLTAHEALHSSTTKFLCGFEGCCMKYLTKASLMLHVRNAHAPKLTAAEAASAAAGSADNKCAVCGVVCESPEALSKHARSHQLKPKRGRPKKVTHPPAPHVPPPMKMEYVEFVTEEETAHDGHNLQNLEYNDIQYIPEGIEGEYELECVQADEMPAEMIEQQIEYLEVETLEEDLED